VACVAFLGVTLYLLELPYAPFWLENNKTGTSAGFASCSLKTRLPLWQTSDHIGFQIVASDKEKQYLLYKYKCYITFNLVLKKFYHEIIIKSNKFMTVLLQKCHPIILAALLSLGLCLSGLEWKGNIYNLHHK
jgi:hypothetical protein